MMKQLIFALAIALCEAIALYCYAEYAIVSAFMLIPIGFILAKVHDSKSYWTIFGITFFLFVISYKLLSISVMYGLEKEYAFDFSISRLLHPMEVSFYGNAAVFAFFFIVNGFLKKKFGK